MLEFNKLERKIAERLGNFAVTPCVGVWIEIRLGIHGSRKEKVTPCVGVWIEISNYGIYYPFYRVTPCVGVWIEILRITDNMNHLAASLPVWECGLKYR